MSEAKICMQCGSTNISQTIPSMYGALCLFFIRLQSYSRRGAELNSFSHFVTFLNTSLRHHTRMHVTYCASREKWTSTGHAVWV